MENKNTTILSVITLTLIIICIVFLMHSCQAQEASSDGGMIFDTDAKPYTPSADLVSDNASGIAVPGYGDIYFPANQNDVQITLYNPEKNDCLFRFELYINDEDKPIAQTDLIKAGDAVKNITLSRSLPAGEYTLNIKVLPYTFENHTPLNNALVRAKLYVVGK